MRESTEKILTKIFRETESLQLVNKDKWAVLSFDNKWIVFERIYDSNKAKIVYRGKSLREAVKVLCPERT